MAGVTLKQVKKVYPNGFTAVHGIDLEVKEGEFMVLVGPSGCAKSTTLRMIAGLEEITAGEISIGGKRVNELPPRDRDIAMVFQNYALYPHMTVYNNMAFGLRQHGQPKREIERRITEAAELLEISHLLKLRPGEMSGGQRQRVALGRAMVRKPGVFLFDEPLSNLDARLRVSTRLSIAQLHQRLKDEGQHTTSIYVTHDQVEAMTLGDRICVLKDGRLMQVDSPMNLYRTPNCRFVAGFIGSPSMNMIEAELLQQGDAVLVRFADGFTLPLPPMWHRAARAAKSAKVWFGIRPEDLLISREEAGTPQTTQCLVNVVEMMGSEQYVYADFNGATFISRQPCRPEDALEHGQQCRLGFALEHCHLFDFESGQRLEG